jgi:hypothetical protein
MARAAAGVGAMKPVTTEGEMGVVTVDAILDHEVIVIGLTK